MKVTLYANYGCLSHEYQTVYTVTSPSPTAVCHDEVEVEIPAEFEPFYNYLHEIVLQIDGERYLLADLLTTTHGKEPCIRWYDGREYHVVQLQRT